MRGQRLETRGAKPDLRTWIVTPLIAMLVRAITAYLQTLVGLMTAAGFGATLVLEHTANAPHGTFLSTLEACSMLALAPAGMSVLSNLLILFTQLGDKFPTLKA